MYDYGSNYLFDPVQAIVFIVGGGNYIEYQNLQDYSKVSVVTIIGASLSEPHTGDSLSWFGTSCVRTVRTIKYN